MISKHIVAILATFLALPIFAADRTWISSSGGKFSNPANWEGGIVPSAGDRLIILTGGFRDTVENDLGYAFDSMLLDGAFPPPNLDGFGLQRTFKGPLTLTNPVATMRLRGEITFTDPVTVPANAHVEIGNATSVSTAYTLTVIVDGGTLTFTKPAGPFPAYLHTLQIIQTGSAPVSVAFLGVDGMYVTRMQMTGDVLTDGSNTMAVNGPLGSESSRITARTGLLGLAVPAAGPITMGPGTFLQVLGTSNSVTMQGALDTRISSLDPIRFGGAFLGQGTLTLQGSSILANQANDWTGLLRVTGLLKLEASEVIPDRNGVELAAENTKLDLANAVETVAGFACPIAGTLSMNLGRGRLRSIGSANLSRCGLTLVVPPGLDASASDEIPVLEMLGGVRAFGRFNDKKEGTTVDVNGVKMRLTYHGGASGMDVTLTKRLRRCAPSPDFSGDCTSDLLRVSPTGGAWVDFVVQGQSVANRQQAAGVTVTHVADFDGDGSSDLLGIDAAQAVKMSLEGQGDAWTTLIPAGTGWLPTLTGDFNGDGASDILWQHQDGRAALWTMNDTTQTGGGVLVPAATGWVITHVGDFNGDGKSDLIWRHTDGRIAMWLMDGGGQVGGGVLLPAGTGWSVKLVADFNGDGKADIVWQHSDGRAAMWIMDGFAQVGGGVLIPGGTGWAPKLVADLDGNGRADLVWERNDGSVAAWLMNGATQVGGGVLRTGAGPVPVTVGDYDDDGRDDIALEGPDGTLTVLLMNGASVRTTTTIAARSGYRLLP